MTPPVSLSLLTPKASWFPYTASLYRVMKCRLRWWHLLLLLALLPGLWQIENFRGRQRWETAAAHLQAQGVSPDWRSYFHQDTVRPEDNVAEHPFFASVRRELIFTGPGDSVSGYFADPDRPVQTLMDGLPYLLLSRRELDLEKWADTLAPQGTGTPADRLLRATGYLDPPLHALHEALQRPHCQWVAFDLESMQSVPLSQIGGMGDSAKLLASLLYARGLAHLELGRSVAAATEIETAIGFAEICKSEPGSLIAAQLRAQMNRAVVDDLETVLVHRSWTDASLETLQTMMGEVSPLDHLDRAVEAGVATSVAYWRAAAERESWARKSVRVRPFLGRYHGLMNSMRAGVLDALPHVMPRPKLNS